MRVHRPLAEASRSILHEVFDNGRVLDHTVAAAFRKNPKWGKRDRHFIADSVWEVVRWRRALGFVADSDEVAALLAAMWQRKGYGIPDWWEWQGATVDEMGSRETLIEEEPRAVRESIPDWLDQVGAEELGNDWSTVLSALNQRAPVFLRSNTLKCSRDELLEWLEQEGVEASGVDRLPDAVRLSGVLPKRLARDGRFEIQDAGSQMIAPLVGAEPGMRVVDACAGAGGKTLHLAALMEGKGEVLALDVDDRKLKQLSERAKRAGVRNVRVAKWSSSTLNEYRGWADCLLIDAPCSGLGTLRRQPDLKWRLSEPQLSKVKRTQRKLLDHYPELLRSGGRFVYSTCSVLPSENERQVRQLLERDPRWTMEESVSVSPFETGFDGFYMARCGRSII